METAQLTLLTERIDAKAAAAQRTTDEVGVSLAVQGRRYKQGLAPAQPMTPVLT